MQHQRDMNDACESKVFQAIRKLKGGEKKRRNPISEHANKRVIIQKHATLEHFNSCKVNELKAFIKLRDPETRGFSGINKLTVLKARNGDDCLLKRAFDLKSVTKLINCEIKKVTSSNNNSELQKWRKAMVLVVPKKTPVVKASRLLQDAVWVQQVCESILGGPSTAQANKNWSFWNTPEYKRRADLLAGRRAWCGLVDPPREQTRVRGCCRVRRPGRCPATTECVHAPPCLLACVLRHPVPTRRWRPQTPPAFAR